MPCPNVIPKSILDRNLTRRELRGCAFCSFDSFDPTNESLNAMGICPTCAGQRGLVEVRICRHCGELFPIGDE